MFQFFWTLFKGQIEPEPDWRAVDSTKKRMNLFCYIFAFHGKQKKFVVSFFGRIWRAQTAFCFIWPLVTSNKIEIFFQIFLAFSKYLNFKIIWSSCCNFTTWINPQGTILQKSVGTPISNPISKFYQQIVDSSIKRLGLA